MPDAGARVAGILDALLSWVVTPQPGNQANKSGKDSLTTDIIIVCISITGIIAAAVRHICT